MLQTSIERQFEHIQRSYANNPAFVGGKTRPGGGAVTPGYDPIIGQAPGNGPREMDEPYPNYPAGNRRTALAIPSEFVTLTAAALFLHAVDHGVAHGADALTEQAHRSRSRSALASALRKQPFGEER